MKQTIWLCRHGIRMDTVDPSWGAQHPDTVHNPPLAPQGVMQARQTGVRLDGEGIQHLFASPFLRAVETAHYMADTLRMPIKIEHGVFEWLNPEWFDQVPDLIPSGDLAQRFPRIDLDYTSAVVPRYPETSDEALTRAGKTVCALADAYTGNLLIIGHGHSVRGMAKALMGVDCSILPDECSLIKIVREDDEFTLELNGDSSHLSGAK
jgi:broad specificity phosphatase PhoE